MLLLSVEFTLFEEEMIISVNSTMLLSTTVRIKRNEFVMYVGTVRVISARSLLVLKEQRPGMSAATVMKVITHAGIYSRMITLDD